MITKTALAQLFKGNITVFAKSRNGKAPKDPPYLRDSLAELMYPLLAKAWKEGHDEASFGIPSDHNPYKETP